MDRQTEARKRWMRVLVVLLALLVIGGGLIGIGYLVGRIVSRSRTSPLATPAPSGLPTPGEVFATYTPLPLATTLPTATPLPPTQLPTATTESAAVPMLTAGENGVNVRSGPGTNYASVGRLDPGTQANVTGSYGDWWQIDYGGTSGWVAGWVVSTTDTDSVAEVVPPASPVPAAVPTSAPAPTDPPAGLALGDGRGLVVQYYQVPGAPGPFAVNQGIPFKFTVVNQGSETLVYDALGTWVEGTSIFQKSYSRLNPAMDPPFFDPGFGITDHTDHVSIPTAGTYNLYLAVHFIDGANITAILLDGPIQVIVQ